MKAVIWIVIVVVLATAYSGYLGYRGYETSSEADCTISLLINYTFALWALTDARKRKYHLPYEFGAFVVLFFYIALPIYLFETRRWKGIGICLGLFAVSLTPWFASDIAYWAGPEVE